MKKLAPITTRRTFLAGVGGTAVLRRALWAQSGSAINLRPYLQNVGPDRATVFWTAAATPGAAIPAGKLEFSVDDRTWTIAASTVRAFLPPQVTVAAGFYRYRAQLPLLPDTRFSYRVSLNEALVEPARQFRSAPAASAASPSFTFLAFGDSGDGGGGQHDLAARLATEAPAFVLHTGDIAYEDGTYEQYRDLFFDIYGFMLGVRPFFLVAGNHDYYFHQGEAFRAYFEPPAGVPALPASGQGTVYSFDWGDVHCAVIDSNLPLEEADAGQAWMLRWLEQDLAATRKNWRMVSFHHPPYPTAKHIDDRNCEMARRLVAPILERQAVHLVLNGHEHNYQRFRPRIEGAFQTAGPGTQYVTTGGGGSGVYPSSPDPALAKSAAMSHYLQCQVSAVRMQITAIDPRGTTVDSFEISAGPHIFESGVVDSAAFRPLVSPGGLISIFGWSLAGGERVATSYPLPKILEGVRLTVNGQLLPVFYVSRRQINAQLPFDLLAGTALLNLETPAGTTQSAMTVRDAAPAVFMIAEPTGSIPAITHADGSLVSVLSPASTGEIVVAYLTGLGRVRSAVVAGDPSPVAPTVVATQVLVNNSEALVFYAGLTPDFAGLYQVNFKVPDGLAAGSHDVRILQGSGASPPVKLAVR